MRAWEITDWTKKKLRRKSWSAGVCVWLDASLDIWVEMHGCQVDRAGHYLNELMNNDDIEEVFELPAKTKDLTWDEARLAWLDGWSVEGGLSFSLVTKWTVDQIVNRTYNLTGNRR